jgi:hypothetical protein
MAISDDPENPALLLRLIVASNVAPPLMDLL